jgi:hypothetical protein
MIELGTVKSVTMIDRPNGSRDVELEVQSYADMNKLFKVRVDPSRHQQHIPVVDQIVAVFRTKYFTRIFAEFGDQPFNPVIEPGEVLIESQGGGFLHANNEGDMLLSDETLSNSVELNNAAGIIMLNDSLVIHTKKVGQITMTPENLETGTEEKIEISKLFGLTKSVNTKIVLTNDKVIIDAPNIEMGRSLDLVTGGSVVSFSPLIGDYSIDLMTGRPIPKSATVTQTVFASPVAPVTT